MLACKALAGLLMYPDEGLVGAVPEIAEILRCASLPPQVLDGVLALCDRLADSDLLESQAEYVALFDGTPSLSLYLFGHVYGDSRDRGQAMVDLLEDYRRKGLEMAGKELPDFLPVFLEFASLHEPPQARDLLGEIADVVALLAERLVRRGTPYASVMRAIEALAGLPADREAVAARVADDRPTETPEALDALYDEAPVDFTKPLEGDTGCPRVASLVAEFSRDPLPPREPSGSG